MIKVTSLHKNVFVVNADLIEIIESTPDTLITLTTGKKIYIVESIDEVLYKVINYRQQAGEVRIKRFENEHHHHHT